MEPTSLSDEQAVSVSRHLAELGGRVCQLMTNVTVAMQSLNLGLASQVVRYEDLAAPYTASTFMAIMTFLGIRGYFADGLVHDKLQQVIGQSHASDNSSPPAPLRIPSHPLSFVLGYLEDIDDSST